MEEKLSPEQISLSKTEAKLAKAKLLSITDNIHKLAPTPPRQDVDINPIAIIEALKADSITQKQFAKLLGLIKDPATDKWIPYREPYMNKLGIMNIMSVIEDINATEFSNFDEDRIPQFAINAYRSNLPHFTIRHQMFGLNKADFNVVFTLLKNTILSAYFKAKGAGHRNVVRGTYSEDILGKAMASESKNKGGIVDKIREMNPLKK